MSRDCLGNALSERPADAIAAIDDFTIGLLGYELRIVKILAAADRCPDDALIQAYAGLLWMLSETGGTPKQARDHLARAERARDRATPREQDAVSVLRHWVGDDVPAALRVIERIVAAHPRDLVMVKIHHYHDFNGGDFPSMLRIALASLPAASDIAYLHGMLAFSYEQCHLLDKAERSARDALALQAQEPWAQHALAHVMLTQGRIAEGIAFLEDVRPGWSGLTSFMDTHLWWHLALFYLSQGRTADVLRVYDEHCWARERDFSQDQIGAVSLLARLEFGGVEVGERWQDLGHYLVQRHADVSQPFLSLQYLYGLVRAGRPEAQGLLGAIRDAAANGSPPIRRVWREFAVELAEGIIAYGAGDHEACWRAIEPHLGRLSEIGGSHAQRDLFEQLVLDALIHAGQLAQAQQRLELRRLATPMDVPTNRQLSEIYLALQLPTLAAEAAGRIAIGSGS